MMRVLVYARPDELAAATERARRDYPDAAVLPRNATAHAPGDLEGCDLCLVHEDFPQVAGDYRGRGYEVELFRTDGRQPEPEVTADPPAPVTPDWDLSMDPETYLERFPDGPNADRARQIVGES